MTAECWRWRPRWNRLASSASCFGSSACLQSSSSVLCKRAYGLESPQDRLGSNWEDVCRVMRVTLSRHWDRRQLLPFCSFRLHVKIDFGCRPVEKVESTTTTSIFAVFQKIDRVKNVLDEPSELLACWIQLACLPSEGADKLTDVRNSLAVGLQPGVKCFYAVRLLGCRLVRVTYLFEFLQCWGVWCKWPDRKFSKIPSGAFWGDMDSRVVAKFGENQLLESWQNSVWFWGQ